jgi:hypothetical protein
MTYLKSYFNAVKEFLLYAGCYFLLFRTFFYNDLLAHYCIFVVILGALGGPIGLIVNKIDSKKDNEKKVS